MEKIDSHLKTTTKTTEAKTTTTKTTAKAKQPGKQTILRPIA